MNLTNSQVELILNAAQLVPNSTRGAFLRSVANRLNDLPVTDQNVHEAVQLVLSTRGIAVAQPMFCCDSRPRITRYRSPNK
jgi:hypothetical protein